ncbi:MAG: hypothetical protein WC817_00555 [Patescibacteria group bacterium]|jgi:hypothetical protein
METETLRVGILFNGFVTAIVSATAFALLLFLVQRWKTLTPGMRSYAWFWGFTSLVWLAVTIRYIMVVAGINTPSIHRVNEFIVETAVFGSGIALYIYLGRQLFKKRLVTIILGVTSTTLACLALWQLLQPNAFHPAEITFFTADPKPNFFFLVIFGILATLGLLMLFYHSIKRFRIWRRGNRETVPYEALYSASLIVYVMLGMIDQAKLIIDWPLIVFRILYTAVFLAAYLIMAAEEARRKDAFIISSEN